MRKHPSKSMAKIPARQLVWRQAAGTSRGLLPRRLVWTLSAAPCR